MGDDEPPGHTGTGTGCTASHPRANCSRSHCHRYVRVCEYLSLCVFGRVYANSECLAYYIEPLQCFIKGTWDLHFGGGNNLRTR